MKWKKKIEKCRELPKSLEEYQWAFDIVIDHYKEARNKKAPKRAKHVIRVMQLTQDMAYAAGWPSGLKSAVVVAACFHDIAKFDNDCKDHAELGARWLQANKKVKEEIRKHMGTNFATNFMGICDSTAWHTKKSPPCDGDGEHTNGEHGLLDKDGFIVLTSMRSVLMGEIVRVADKLDKERHVKKGKMRCCEIRKKIEKVFISFELFDASSPADMRKWQDSLRRVETERLSSLCEKYSDKQ